MTETPTKPLTRKQRRRIKDLAPRGEWWKSATGEAYEAAFAQLLSTGIEEDAAFSLLESLFYRTADEFGGLG